jgi:hypothetical protein
MFALLLTSGCDYFYGPIFILQFVQHLVPFAIRIS